MLTGQNSMHLHGVALKNELFLDNDSLKMKMLPQATSFKGREVDTLLHQREAFLLKKGPLSADTLSGYSKRIL